MSEVIETLDVTATARERGFMFGEKVQIVATLLFDDDVTPDDFDCYSGADKEAWRADQWRFVGVEVSVHVADALAYQDSLWGVEHGSLGEVECDPLRDEHPLWDGMVSDALEQAAANLREAIAQLD